MSNFKTLEDRFQADLILHAWNKYPQTRGLICYNLNNSKNSIDGAKNKAKGLIKGRADLTFYWRGKAYFFELKVENGSQSPDQKEWENLVRSHGFIYLVVKSIEYFDCMLNLILENRL